MNQIRNPWSKRFERGHLPAVLIKYRYRIIWLDCYFLKIRIVRNNFWISGHYLSLSVPAWTQAGPRPSIFVATLDRTCAFHFCAFLSSTAASLNLGLGLGLGRRCIIALKTPPFSFSKKSDPLLSFVVFFLFLRLSLWHGDLVSERDRDEWKRGEERGPGGGGDGDGLLLVIHRRAARLPEEANPRGVPPDQSALRPRSLGFAQGIKAF